MPRQTKPGIFIYEGGSQKVHFWPILLKKSGSKLEFIEPSS
jgi:hypothetical protein